MGALIDGVTETVKNELKKQEGGFLRTLLVPLAASIVQPGICLVVKGLSGRGVRRVRRGYIKISRLLIISITNLDLIAFFFQETIYLE